MPNELLYNYFDDDDFLMISEKIKEMEKITSGEIRLAVKEKIPFYKRKKNIKELAEEEFHSLGMDNTRDKTGILIYILLASRQFYIIADSGIDSLVQQKTWDGIRDEMQSELKLGHFLEGIISTIDKVGKILSEFFPIKSDDTNELSNKVVL
ncbi:MAG: TPM domain-containing protein [Bacteroidota bacterium]